MIALLLAPAAGRADDPPDPAQTNEVGKVLFAEGDFETARTLWESAFGAARGSDELALATNLGITCFRLGSWADALYYFSFARAHEDLGHDRIKKHQKVTKALQTLRRKLAGGTGRLEIRTRPSPNAEVCVGELERTCRKAPADWHLPPGLHQIRVTLPGEASLTETVRIQKGQTTRRDLLLPEGPDPQDCTAVAAGGNHTCLLSRDGTLRCAGDNRRGQLGIDRGDWYLRRPLPVEGPGLPIRIVGAGHEHTCAITDAGTVFCWGEGSKGRLGNGALERPPSWSPIPVVGLPGDARALAVGRDHSCVALGTGAVYCWGANSNGQIGAAGDEVASAVAVPVQEPGGRAVALTAGYGFTCVLLDGGEIRCWGRSPTGNSSAPIPLKDPPTGISSIAAGDRHLAILAGTDVWVAGARSGLQKIKGITGARRIAAGGDRTCALLEDGAVRCVSGGSTQTVDIYEPGDPAGIDLSVGPNHLCVVLTDGRYRCSGQNALGQLGR
ncbi:MAG: PEGA domain-containing protein [Pseudomonadota bacterium]